MPKSIHNYARILASLVATATFSVTLPTIANAGGEVNIYSYRQPFLVKPLFDGFTKRTGIKVNVIYAKKGLVERIKAEGKLSPADLMFTADIGRVDRAVKAGITQGVSSPRLIANVPASYRATNGHWYGLTLRSRVIYASRNRVKQNDITYEELADPKWKGKICIRSGQQAYNIALFASMIAHHGEAKAEKWLRGLKANLARKPGGSDRNQVKGVYSGECDIAIANNYYMGKMMTNKKKPEQQKWAASARMLFPNTKGRGTHVNLSAVAMAKHAPNKTNALKMMEYLSSSEGQKIYAQANYEYPVKDGVEWSAIAKSWGTFKFDKLPLAQIAKNRAKASKMVDRVLFNDGPST